MSDAWPTVVEPDNDPHVWLEDIDSEDALAWVEKENRRTRERFENEDFRNERDELKAALDRHDQLPTIVRRGGVIYNYWTDEAHPRGVWRRTALERFRANEGTWNDLFDLDALANAESENWVWAGAKTLPPLHDRAIFRLSRGGGDAVVLREWDLAAQWFVKDGFTLGEAMSDVGWLDKDTLLLMSTFGDDAHATRSGKPRTVRLWRRSTAIEDAPVLFSVPVDHVRAKAKRDWNVAEETITFTDIITFFDDRRYFGNRSGPLQTLDLPTTARVKWQGEAVAMLLREPWTVDEKTYAADTVLGLQLQDVLGGTPHPTVLWCGGDRSGVEGFFFVNGHLLLALLQEMRPHFLPFHPDSLGSWRNMAPLIVPDTGEVSVMSLDGFKHESDGSLLIRAQDPLTPPAWLLTRVGESASPTILRQASPIFSATGLVVTRHEAVAEDGERIPYFQTGPDGPPAGQAPVHLTGYSGFGTSRLPCYQGVHGKLWLQQGGTTVLACIRGGGEFGTRWHEAGRGRLKARSHADFAAVAADLVRRGVTRPDRIVAEGRSSEGLLVANMHARFCRYFGGLFCVLPLTDMRRYMKLRAGASWLGEYGEDWKDLANISAYHLASTPTGSEPPMLITTNRRDDRMHPGHARKYAAKLRALGHPVWFYEHDDSGHARGTNNRDIASLSALGASFLRDAIGWGTN